MGLSTKVFERQTSNQTELFGTILGNLELYDYFMGECLLTFFFPINLWEMSINFYIGFHKNKIKKFIGLNSQIFGTIFQKYI